MCGADMSMPSFVDFLKSAVVKAGESARLQCTVDCKPTPAKITWYVCLSVCLCVRLRSCTEGSANSYQAVVDLCSTTFIAVCVLNYVVLFSGMRCEI